MRKGGVIKDLALEAENLKLACRDFKYRRGLLLADIERAAGFKPGHLSRLTNKRVALTLEDAERLCSVLEVPLERLSSRLAMGQGLAGTEREVAVYYAHGVKGASWKQLVDSGTKLKVKGASDQAQLILFAKPSNEVSLSMWLAVVEPADKWLVANDWVIATTEDQRMAFALVVEAPIKGRVKLAFEGGPEVYGLVDACRLVVTLLRRPGHIISAHAR
jgi:transcriptional regulator with XRE-family HTH domain|tara:strand:- start:390 stop:1043 length:654 start_codon:yes stop_codon:yes gene_type:complete